MKKYINTFLFVAFPSAFFILCLGRWYFEKPFSHDAVENHYNSNVYCGEEFINLYGLVQNVLGKRAIENFTLFQNDYGNIVSPKEKRNIIEIDNKIEEIKPIFDWLEEEDIPYYYLTNVLPITTNEDLPWG